MFFTKISSGKRLFSLFCAGMLTALGSTSSYINAASTFPSQHTTSTTTSQQASILRAQSVSDDTVHSEPETTNRPKVVSPTSVASMPGSTVSSENTGAPEITNTSTYTPDSTVSSESTGAPETTNTATYTPEVTAPSESTGTPNATAPSEVAPNISNLYLRYTGSDLTEPATLDASAFVLTAVYDNGTTATITDYEFTSSLEITEEGETTISVAYGGKSATCKVTLNIPKKEERYAITFDSKGGSIVPPIQNIKPNSIVTVSSMPKKSGYWFRGWYLEETYQTEYTAQTAITGNLTLYAKWEEKENKEKDTITQTMNLPKFATILSVDLTGHQYGAHVAPVVSSVPAETIASAVKNVAKSNNPSYYAFRFVMEDYTYQKQLPLKTTITLPSSYDANKVTLYYTPDNKLIEGACAGTPLSANTYQFSAYENGTYIVVQESEDPNATAAPSTAKAPSVTLSLASYVLINGQTAGVIQYHDFNEEQMNPEEELSFKWKSSNKKVAKVDQNGIVTGIKPGKATISIVSTDKEKKYQASAVILVTKKKVPATSLSVSKIKYKIKEGNTAKIKATISPAKATVRTPRYTSSNKAIATVSKKGKIKGIKKGKCKITVATTDGSKLSKKISVTVY